MNTLTDIKKRAEAPVAISVDDSTPAGHFVATTVISGLVTTYLLEGEESSEEAVIKGRVEIISMSPYVYIGGGLKGGSWAGKPTSYAEAFAKMV